MHRSSLEQRSLYGVQNMSSFFLENHEIINGLETWVYNEPYWKCKQKTTSREQLNETKHDMKGLDRVLTKRYTLVPICNQTSPQAWELDILSLANIFFRSNGY